MDIKGSAMIALLGIGGSNPEATPGSPCLFCRSRGLAGRQKFLSYQHQYEKMGFEMTMGYQYQSLGI